MSTKAKFFVSAAEHSTGQDPEHMQGTVRLNAVCRGAINSKWAAATPSGSMQMYINNPPAFRWFHDRIGKEVAITIEDANHDPATHEFVPMEITDEQRADAEKPYGYLPYGHDLCLECGYEEDRHQ